jgi:hypothetical protein
VNRPAAPGKGPPGRAGDFPAGFVTARLLPGRRITMMAGRTISGRRIPMRGLVMLGGVAVVLAAAGAWTKPAVAQDDKTYDLRGPAPEKGQVYLSKMTLKINDADTTLKVMGQTIKLKMSMNMIGEEEQKVLAVDGRNVTKCQTKVIKERAEITADIGGGQTMTEPTALEGEIIISERVGEGKWKHSLVDNKPSDKQKKELDNRIGMENDDELYPAEKVKVGHKWTVKAAALTKLFGNSFTDVKGELKQTFVKVEKVDGEDCAVIDSQGTVKGKMKDEDGEPALDVEMELKVTSWREIKTGVEVKSKLDGKIKLAGKQKIDDASVDITLSGPFTGDSTGKLKGQ